MYSLYKQENILVCVHNSPCPHLSNELSDYDRVSWSLSHSIHTAHIHLAPWRDSRIGFIEMKDTIYVLEEDKATKTVWKGGQTREQTVPNRCWPDTGEHRMLPEGEGKGLNMSFRGERNQVVIMNHNDEDKERVRATQTRRRHAKEAQKLQARCLGTGRM